MNTPHDPSQWRKSRRSNPSGNCTEVKQNEDGTIQVRNSRFPEAASLCFTRAEIDAFFGGVKDGEFDYLLG